MMSLILASQEAYGNISFFIGKDDLHSRQREKKGLMADALSARR
jgi:hypothetical protein